MEAVLSDRFCYKPTCLFLNKTFCFKYDELMLLILKYQNTQFQTNLLFTRQRYSKVSVMNVLVNTVELQLSALQISHALLIIRISEKNYTRRWMSCLVIFFYRSIDPSLPTKKKVTRHYILQRRTVPDRPGIKVYMSHNQHLRL